MPSFKLIGRKGLEVVAPYLDRIPDDGRDRVVEIRLHRKHRSVPQNKLYWLWVTIIAAETGNISEELHELFKAMFLGVKTIRIAGREQSIPRSTRELGTDQFTRFLEQLEAWAGVELGCVLPHPEDVYYNEIARFYGF